ncbi:hypothetical protein CYMTET_46762 [Cymbomonas tetramitiformis]|uniref:Uncharacterized protein n=1 Tax=Cymbomonas tetramitiformis TaxID=36881 RepID=A0AAE0EXB4_9CHLO|nr:hypothetical protein CYMTET_46762 [Cymbomonas tetramitiformis]
MEKREYGLGMELLPVVYAQTIFSSLQKAIHSEEGNRTVMTPHRRERNLKVRLHMSHVSRSTKGLVEYHSENRQNCENLPQLWGGKQTRYNTLRKCSQRSTAVRHNSGGHRHHAAELAAEIIQQLEGATRERTHQERKGSSVKTGRGKIEDGEMLNDDPTKPLKGPRVKNVARKTDPKTLNFTACLTLFRHFRALPMLKSEDGDTAVSTKHLGVQCQGQTLLKHKKAIKTGMLHLYPYICHIVPGKMEEAKSFYKSEENRELKPQYKQVKHTGPIDEHTRETKLPQEQPESLLRILEDWRATGEAESEIEKRFSLHPLTYALARRQAEEDEEPWTNTWWDQAEARDAIWSLKLVRRERKPRYTRRNWAHQTIQ